MEHDPSATAAGEFTAVTGAPTPTPVPRPYDAVPAAVAASVEAGAPLPVPSRGRGSWHPELVDAAPSVFSDLDSLGESLDDVRLRLARTKAAEDARRGRLAALGDVAAQLEAQVAAIERELVDRAQTRFEVGEEVRVAAGLGYGDELLTVELQDVDGRVYLRDNVGFSQGWFHPAEVLPTSPTSPVARAQSALLEAARVAVESAFHGLRSLSAELDELDLRLDEAASMAGELAALRGSLGASERLIMTLKAQERRFVQRAAQSRDALTSLPALAKEIARQSQDLAAGSARTAELERALDDAQAALDGADARTRLAEEEGRLAEAATARALARVAELEHEATAREPVLAQLEALADEVRRACSAPSSTPSELIEIVPVAMERLRSENAQRAEGLANAEAAIADLQRDIEASQAARDTAGTHLASLERQLGEKRARAESAEARLHELQEQAAAHAARAAALHDLSTVVRDVVDDPVAAPSELPTLLAATVDRLVAEVNERRTRQNDCAEALAGLETTLRERTHDLAAAQRELVDHRDLTQTMTARIEALEGAVAGQAHEIEDLGGLVAAARTVCRDDTPGPAELPALLLALFGARSPDGGGAVPAAPSARAVVAQGAPRSLTRDIEVVQNRLVLTGGPAIDGLAVACYQVYAPWRPPVVLGVDMDLQSDALSPELLSAGPLLAQARVEDPGVASAWPAWPGPDDAILLRHAPWRPAATTDAESHLIACLAGADTFSGRPGAAGFGVHLYGRAQDLAGIVGSVDVRALAAAAIAADPAGALRSIASDGIPAGTCLAPVVAAGLTMLPRLPVVTDAQESLLWNVAPAIAALASSHALPDPSDEIREQIVRRCGAVAISLLCGERDPYPTAGSFDGNTMRMQEWPAEQLDRAWHAAAIVPTRMLEADARAIAARDLFDARTNSEIQDVASTAASRVKEFAELFLHADLPSAVQAVEARGTGEGWVNLPALSLALAFASRLAARGDDDARSQVEGLLGTYVALATHAPGLVGCDLVLAEFLLCGMTTSQARLRVRSRFEHVLGRLRKDLPPARANGTRPVGRPPVDEPAGLLPTQH